MKVPSLLFLLFKVEVGYEKFGLDKGRVYGNPTG